MNGSGFAPPLPAPSSSFPVIHTSQLDQQRRQCEGVSGRYQEHCQQPGQMMPGYAMTPGLPPGLPAHLAAPPCIAYCTLPSGDQSTYDERTGSWNPPLTALSGSSLSGFGDVGDTAESLFWKVTKSAAAFVVAYKVAQSMDQPAKTSKVVGWAAAGAAFLFL